MRFWKVPRKIWVPLAGLAAMLIVAVPVALASHQFTDVPDSNPFHDDISAIALAGVTTGKTCVPPGTPPTYCPSENVTRQAMAAFMRRGFGRVGQTYMPPANLPACCAFSTPSGWTLALTPGLPAGALAGATGFIKADATVNVCNNTPTDIYQVAAVLRLDGASMATYAGVQDVFPQGGCSVIGLTGAASVTAPGPHTISVQVAGGTGVADEIVADGVVTGTYYPFGSTGTNTLGAAAAAPTDTVAKKTQHLGRQKRS